MQWVEDDAETNPVIPVSQLEYVRCLPDRSTQYTRFFDALLIVRSSHPAFFRDLRTFRELPTTIRTLALCNPDCASTPKERRKEFYRSVTKQFLGSRFAHPWCKAATTGNDSLRAGGLSGAKRRTSKDAQAQEDSSHKLLMPLWVCFRAKMFPGEVVVERWWEEYQLHPHSKTPKDLLNLSPDGSESTLGDDGLVTASNTVSFHVNRHANSPPDETWVEKDDDDDDDDAETRDPASMNQHAGSVATGLLRLAAAGMLINSMSRMQKWKLKREIKRQKS